MVMFKNIDPVAWAVLALAVIGAKLFLLPDTELMATLTVVVAGLCGVGAVISMNKLMDSVAPRINVDRGIRT